ncbi:DUF4920 domain-containing protein [Marinicella sp. W31]|uniref:DUF4920 domain-containing protein n=1 Tax=Marinicella sp. W31 TaxID=3023713 RepID=UPI0037574231
MKKYFSILLLLVSSTLMANSLVGALAPDFSMSDQKGTQHSLEDFKGRWIVLYFYPKNDTPGCTVEAQKFRDRHDEITGMNAAVVGVSLDDQSSHAQFAKKYQLPFTLLSDANEKASTAYGVLGGFGPMKHSKRQTFIIDPDGTIVKHYQSVSPQEHAQQVITDLQEAQELYQSITATSKTEEKPVVTEYQNGHPVYGQHWPQQAMTEMSITAAIGDFENVVGEGMVFTGEVTQVCQKKGCWMVLTNGDMFARVDFDNHSFFIPKNTQGQARVYGELNLKKLSEEKLKHLESDGATGLEKQNYEIKALSVMLM